MNVASWLHGLYLFTTVFGVGITAVDLLGLLGADGGDGDGVGDADGAAAAGGHVPVLSVLRYLRMGVYFSLGFGPVGLVAEATGTGVLGGLAWALPGGIVAAWLARAFFRFQQRDVGSSVQEEELLLERARVIVPMSGQDMGKIRLQIGPLVVERYALAEEEWESFRTGDVVEIMRLSDECVYVRRAATGTVLDEP